jgi:outer membrane protein OmpA-like peptidoglycan-associated protein
MLHPAWEEVEMMNRIFIALLLSAALALPAFAQQSIAQQTNSNANPPAAAAGQTTPPYQAAATPDLPPLPPVTSTDFWDGDEPNVINLVRHPFATKKYVQRHTRPIRDRLNELEELTTSNTRMIRDVDTRAQQGIQLASEKTSLADQHATDATNQAQVAQTAATRVTTQVSGAEQMVGSLDQYKTGAQTEIRFRPGQSALSKQAKDALDQLAASLKDQRSYIVEVHGFAGGKGQAAIANSRTMANSVVRYLVQSYQIPVYRIYAVGMGNAPAAGEGTAARHIGGGLVEVNVLKNDMVSSAQH